MLQNKRILNKIKPSMKKFCTQPDMSVKSMVVKFPMVVQNVKDIVVTKYSRQSAATKEAFGVYIFFGFISFVILTFNDGFNSLKKNKETIEYKKASYEKQKKSSKKAIAQGCRKHMFCNIIKSAVFPYVLVMDGIPALVYGLNEL